MNLVFQEKSVILLRKIKTAWCNGKSWISGGELCLEHVAGEVVPAGPFLLAGKTETAEPEIFPQLGPPILPLLLTEGAAVAVGHLLPLLDVGGGGRNDKFAPVNPHHVWVAGVVEHGHGRSDDLTYRAGRVTWDRRDIFG